MGSESSKSDSNSSKSESESSSNSGNKDGKLETMECKTSNLNTIIKRVWIAKKSISLSDEHVDLFMFKLRLGLENFDVPKLAKPKKNIFKIKNEWNCKPKHWAIILELSNDSYVNIQFGRNGFSLKEFNKTQIEGENILNAILNIWGEKDHPASFCYLGHAKYDYEKLKKYLRKIKEKEIKNFNENRKIFYNVVFRNCQHFVCDIEKILFNGIIFCHSFDFYLEGFFKRFFPNKNINELKLKVNETIKKENEEIYQNNLKLIEDNEKKKEMNYPRKDVKIFMVN